MLIEASFSREVHSQGKARRELDSNGFKEQSPRPALANSVSLAVEPPTPRTMEQMVKWDDACNQSDQAEATS